MVSFCALHVRNYIPINTQQIIVILLCAVLLAHSHTQTRVTESTIIEFLWSILCCVHTALSQQQNHTQNKPIWCFLCQCPSVAPLARTHMSSRSGRYMIMNAFDGHCKSCENEKNPVFTSLINNKVIRCKLDRTRNRIFAYGARARAHKTKPMMSGHRVPILHRIGASSNKKKSEKNRHKMQSEEIGIYYMSQMRRQSAHTSLRCDWMNVTGMTEMTTTANHKERFILIYLWCFCWDNCARVQPFAFSLHTNRANRCCWTFAQQFAWLFFLHNSSRRSLHRVFRFVRCGGGFRFTNQTMWNSLCLLISSPANPFIAPHIVQRRGHV